jgi:hypothetical protein
VAGPVQAIQHLQGPGVDPAARQVVLGTGRITGWSGWRGAEGIRGLALAGRSEEGKTSVLYSRKSAAKKPSKGDSANSTRISLQSR